MRYGGEDLEFVTLASEKISFGFNKFVEISRRKWTRGKQEGEFIAISKGTILSNGTERFSDSIGLPDDPEIKKFIAERINYI